MPQKIILPFYLMLSLFSCAQKDINISLDEIKEYRLNIVIPDTSFEKIISTRNKAIEKKILREKNYVNGIVYAGKDTCDIKIRLKGDHTDHFKGNRWSYRIKTKSKILGEKKFSIQGVHTRLYLYEWVFHELLENEGLIRLQYEFIPVTINDIDSFSGIYAFESHFRSEVLEMQSRAIGPILKFDETVFWDYSQKPKEGESRDEWALKLSEIEITNKKSIPKEKRKNAVDLLKSYVQGELGVQEVFDLDKWARYFVVNSIMATKHALRWHNLRFYFNPETQKIEPIGFDCGSWRTKKGAWHLFPEKMESFYQPFYESKEFIRLLLKHTERMSRKNYLSSFFNTRLEEMEKNIALIRQEKEGYKFWKNSFLKDLDKIRQDFEGFELK